VTARRAVNHEDEQEDAVPSPDGQLDNAEENAYQRWELDGGELHEGS
jgi:hypothetical protein